MMRILSLGAGVQSTTILLMAARGELPKPDHAIFSDTGWEPKAVYEHLARLCVQCDVAEIPLHVVSNGNIREDQKNAAGKKVAGKRYAALPLYVKVPGQEREGIIRRQCTSEYKITPIHRKIRELVGLKPRQPYTSIWGGEPMVEHWFGITADEAQRMRGSQAPWIVNRYPLIQDFDPPMTRADCRRWLTDAGWETTPRSSCIGCPFHSNDHWRFMRDHDPEAWADAVAFDREIRQRDGMRGEAFLHRSLKPLDEVDFGVDEDTIDLFGNECEGMCGT